MTYHNTDSDSHQHQRSFLYTFIIFYIHLYKNHNQFLNIPREGAELLDLAVQGV